MKQPTKQPTIEDKGKPTEEWVTNMVADMIKIVQEKRRLKRLQES